MKKNLNFVLCCLIILFWVCFGGATAAQNVPSEVIQAASVKLPVYVNLTFSKGIEVQHEFGFEDNDASNEIYLGKPFQLHELSYDAVLSFQNTTSMSSALVPKAEWYFPVIAADQFRSVLVVSKMGDSFRVVSFGKAGLARELAKIRHQWPADNGYQPILIACYVPSYRWFFTVPEVDDYNIGVIIPRLSNQRTAENLKIETAYNLIKQIQAEIVRNGL